MITYIIVLMQFAQLTLLTSDDYILNIIYISCIFAEATFQQVKICTRAENIV